MPLTRLVYYSENLISSAAGSMFKDLSSILRASHANNRGADLTGALICDDMWFLQALEGERHAVWKTFERLRDDERHANVTVAEVVEIDRRRFGNWWMGLATRSEKNEYVFQPFLINGRLDPNRMTAAQMLSLMVGVARLGLSRELATS